MFEKFRTKFSLARLSYIRGKKIKVAHRIAKRLMKLEATDDRETVSWIRATIVNEYLDVINDSYDLRTSEEDITDRVTDPGILGSGTLGAKLEVEGYTASWPDIAEHEINYESAAYIARTLNNSDILEEIAPLAKACVLAQEAKNHTEVAAALAWGYAPGVLEDLEHKHGIDETVAILWCLRTDGVLSKQRWSELVDYLYEGEGAEC